MDVRGWVLMRHLAVDPGLSPMTHTPFSLARRFPVAQFSVMLLPLLLITACEPGQLKEGLAPNESDVVQVTVLPAKSTITVAETVLVSASARTATGQSAPAEVDWTSNGGTLMAVTDSSALFSATTSGSYYVRGRGRKNPKLQDSTVIVVSQPVSPIVSLSISPASATLSTGGSLTFLATATRGDGATFTPSVTWAATGGTISSTGLFIAGNSAGNYRVVATEQTSTLADTSSVTLSTATPVLEAVVLTPASVTVAAGGTQQFNVGGRWSDGSTTAPSVTFSTTGGTITPGGLFTAGSVTGTFQVIAVQQGGTLADTSAVSVSTSAPMLEAVILTPASVSLATGGTHQFSVSGQWSNGATTAPAVTYSATGGTVTAGGLYTAGATSGTFRVIATQQGGTLADTSTVTLTVPPPVLQAVILTPSSVALATGATQQFSVSGQWSNGATTAPAVTYSATGGTVTAGGLYTAGSTAGTFRVIATQQGGTLADTSTVTLTTTPPALQAVILTPPSASLTTGGTQQFSVSGQWSNGATTAPAVTYSATGGTVSSGGLYSAGTTVGTFRVIATQQGGILADTSNVTVTVPSSGGWLANKPANFTNVRTNYGFDAPIPSATSDQPMGDGSGWNVYYGFWPVHNSARISDASGGVSPTYVVQTDYPANTRGNTKFYFQPISASASEFYVAMRVKWDSNYEWNDISNKLFYIEPGNLVLQSRHNVGGIQRYLSVYIGANDSDHLPTNNVPITLGQWHTIEYLVRRGTTNGEIHIWLDGVTTLHETGIFVPTTSSSNLLDINDTFGGGGPNRTRTSTRWIDHVYIATP